MGQEETLPDHLRCKRTDGRQWRCSRRAMDNVKLCEIHYLQGRHRQYKEKVPESLKIKRKCKKGLNNKNDSVLNNVETKALKLGKMAKMMRKRLKTSDDSVTTTEAPVRKKSSQEVDKQLELIKMVLKREVEKRKKKKKKQGEKEKKKVHYSEGELTKELPNGIMAISGASTPQEYCNGGSYCDVKVSIDHKAVTQRRFRSKNVERLSLGKLQVGITLYLFNFFEVYDDLCLSCF